MAVDTHALSRAAGADSSALVSLTGALAPFWALRAAIAAVEVLSTAAGVVRHRWRALGASAQAAALYSDSAFTHGPVWALVVSWAVEAVLLSSAATVTSSAALLYGALWGSVIRGVIAAVFGGVYAAQVMCCSSRLDVAPVGASGVRAELHAFRPRTASSPRSPRSKHAWNDPAHGNAAAAGIDAQSWGDAVAAAPRRRLLETEVDPPGGPYPVSSAEEVRRALAPLRGKRVCITGGGGFLGSHIVEQLLDPALDAPQPAQVTCLDLMPPHESRVPPALLRDARLVWVQGSVCDADAVARAVEGADIVLHAASVVDFGNVPPEVIRDVNVGGTRNVIGACATASVTRLIYTSTMDVVLVKRAMFDIDEKVGYPDPPSSALYGTYAATKVQAEQEVIMADGLRTAPTARSRGDGGVGAGDGGDASDTERIRTSCIRPLGLFGARDPHHLGQALRASRNGSVFFRFGDGAAPAVFTHVYVGNCAYAHLVAAAKLLVDPTAVAGRAYFVCDNSPVQNMFSFLTPFLLRAGLWEVPHIWIPAWVMHPVAAVAMAVTAVLKAVGIPVVNVFTHEVVNGLVFSNTFHGRRLVRDAGYKPRFTHEEALERTFEWIDEDTAAYNERQRRRRWW